MNKRLIKITSEVNKKAFIQLLNDMRRDCTDRNLIIALTNIGDSLAKQEASSFKSCLDRDDSIKTVLNDIKKDIKSDFYEAAKLHTDVVKDLVDERAKLCPRSLVGLSKQEIKRRKIAEKVNFKRAKEREKLIKKGLPVASTYTEDELFDFLKIQVKQDCAKYRAQADELRTRILQNKNDKDAVDSFKLIELKYNGACKRLNLLNNELYRTTLVGEVKLFTDTQKELIAKRTVSDDQFEVMMRDFAEAQQKADEDKKKVDAAGELFNHGTGAYAAGNAQSEAAFTSDSAQSEADYILHNSQLMQELGGMPNEQEEALKEVLENIEPTIVALKNSSDQFEKDKIKYDVEIERYEDQLWALRPEYAAANASKSKSVADRIKTINSLRLASIKNRDRVIRAKDQLNKQIEMAIGLKGIKDIEAAKKRASDIMGSKFSLENWAMFMKNYDKNENSLLDEIETTLDVANSENVNLTALPVSDVPYQSEISKDEHLFDALWDEIEKRRNEGNQ